MIGREELTELSPRNAVRAKKLTELPVSDRTLRNRILPVTDVPLHQKPERGHIRQNRPFTKPPVCFLSKDVL